jgi:hypothetical protein
VRAEALKAESETIYDDRLEKLVDLAATSSD